MRDRSCQCKLAWENGHVSHEIHQTFPFHKMSEWDGIMQSETIEYVELLPTGTYTVRTVPSLQLVGRNLVEEASFDPKGVYGQPMGVPLSPNTSFTLHHAGGDSYYITVGRDRGRVVAIEGRVAAVLNSEQDVWGLQEVDLYDELPMNQRWAVRRQPQHGDDVYTYVCF